MVFDRDKQVVCAAIVQKEQTLSNAPKRRRAKFVWSGRPLNDVIGEEASHVMHQKIGEQINGPVLQHGAVHCRRGLHLRRMAQPAPDVVKDSSAANLASSGARTPGIDGMDKRRLQAGLD